MNRNNERLALEKKISVLEDQLRDYRRTFAFLMGTLPGMTYICQNDENWTMAYVSEGCFELTGYQPRDLIGNHLLSYNDLIHPDDRLNVWVDIQEAVAEKKMFQFIYRIITARDREKRVWEQGMGIFSDQGRLLALAGFISDIVNHSLVGEAESRLGALFRVHQMEQPTTRKIISFALKEALLVTNSSVAHFALVDESSGTVTHHGLNFQTDMNTCQLTSEPQKSKLREVGLWVEAVRRRKPFLVNGDEDPHSSGLSLPMGHVPLYRYLCIPVVADQRIVAVTGVGNKPSAYNEVDIDQLTLLMQGIWRLILGKIPQDQQPV